MLLEKFLSKKSEPKLQHELYKSIDDLPQWNWNQVHKTGNHAYLKKLDSYRNIEEDNSEEIIEEWNKIYDEFIGEFGISKRYLELLEIRKTIANLQIEFIKTGERSILNEIEIEEMDLKEEFESKDEVRYESVVMSIEKRQGMHIDSKGISVYKFNNYIRTIKEERNGE